MDVKCFLLNDKGQSLEVSHSGQTLVFAVLTSTHVSRIEVTECYETEEAAKSVFDAMTEEGAKEVLPRFSFCSDFVKGLINGLSKAKTNANTKKPIEPDSRAHGGSTYGRHAIRNAAAGGAYSKR